MAKVTEQLSEAHEVVMGRHEEGVEPHPSPCVRGIAQQSHARIHSTVCTARASSIRYARKAISRAQLEEIAMGMNNILDAEVVEEGELDANSTGRSATPS